MRKTIGACSIPFLLMAAIAVPAQTVTFKKFHPPTAKSEPWGITSGTDGALWFTEFKANQIARITTAGVMTEYPIPTAKSGPWGITAGPDGALWFTEGNTNKIGRITAAGVVTAEYAIPTTTSNPWEITSGPDGNLWFTELNPPFCIAFVCLPPPYDGYIERITTSGTVTVFPLPAPIGGLGSPGIAEGSDGALWFAGSSNSSIGSIATTGVIGQHPLPNPAAIPQGMAAGGDGALWLTEAGASRPINLFMIFAHPLQENRAELRVASGRTPVIGPSRPKLSLAQETNVESVPILDGRSRVN